MYAMGYGEMGWDTVMAKYYKPLRILVSEQLRFEAEIVFFSPVLAGGQERR